MSPEAHLLYLTPWLMEDTSDTLTALTNIPAARVTILTREPRTRFPDTLLALAHFERVADMEDLRALRRAALNAVRRVGPITQVISDSEETQIAAAWLRKTLGVPGMRPAIARRFRDKSVMKHAFNRHGVPCARFARVRHVTAARRFANGAGFPIVIKPVAGARASHTFLVGDHSELERRMRHEMQRGRTVLLEEHIRGIEYSCESLTLRGLTYWQSGCEYSPSALEAQRSRIPFFIVLPRDYRNPRWRQAFRASRAALKGLGMTSGLTHLEWFYQESRGVLVSEVGARPPGARIMDLLSAAHSVSFTAIWAALVAENRKVVPPRRMYAAGVAFLRGSGTGPRIASISGWKRALAAAGGCVVSAVAPEVGAAAARDYEGDANVVVRHRSTGRVKELLRSIAHTVRIRYG